MQLGWLSKIKSINALVKQRLHVAGLAQKKQKDKTIHPSKVEVGDFVYVWTPNCTPGISPKLASNWSGPILVIARDDPNVMLEWSQLGLRLKSQVNKDRLLNDFLWRSSRLRVQ